MSEPVPEERWLGSYKLESDNQLQTDRIEVCPGCVRAFHGDERTVWPLSFAEWTPAENEQASVRAAKTENGLLLHICYVTTPFEVVLELIFTAHGIEIRGQRNVGFGRGSFGIVGYKE